MSIKRLAFITNYSYHIYNRTIADTKIFNDIRIIERFLDLIDYYRFPQYLRFSKYANLSSQLKKDYLNKIIIDKQPLVEIYTFDCHDNHFHIQLKQLQNNGIRIFASNVQNSFAKFYNTKNQRSGSLFQNSFKSVFIESDSQFVHLSRYIHLQPVTARKIEFDQLSKQVGNSYIYYADEDIAQNRLFDGKYNNSKMININDILTIFGSAAKYKIFVAKQVNYQRKLDSIKKLYHQI